MKKVINLLLLSCKKASELIDKSSMVKLNTRERVMLRMHTSMCDACSAYQSQSKVIDTVLHKHLNKTEESSVPPVVNDELKSKIISKL